MCLIIAPGKDNKPALLPRDVFDYVYNKNDDGFGAMWVEDGQVKHFKGLSPSADNEYKQMEELTAKHPGVVFHMRYRTHGETIPGLSHPFRLLHRNRHGHDMFFMHNGILGQFGGNLSYGQSDTTVFKDKILLPLLTRNPDALDDPEVWQAIEELTKGSRLIFMRSDGKTWLTHPTSWNNRYGLTLSNTYMLPYETKTSNVHTLPSTSTASTTTKSANLFTLFRLVATKMGSGTPVKHWCRHVVDGMVRSESGQLFRDPGNGQVIVFDRDFIPKEKEGEEIQKQIVINKAKTTAADLVKQAAKAAWGGDDDDDYLNDDLPWKSEEDDVAITVAEKSGSPAPLDERLRYARIVHNCHNGNVSNRTQLLGDLTCMSNKELYEFVKADPENANTAFVEILDVLIEMNELLQHDPTCEEMCFDTDELLEVGAVTGQAHVEAMRVITTERRKAYEELIASRGGKKEVA